MKLQNIYVNNRFEHVVNYDLKEEHVENFIINKEDGSTIQLVKFDDYNATEKTFGIETETGKLECYFKGGEIKKEQEQENHITITLSFTDKKEDNNNKKNDNKGSFFNKPTQNGTTQDDQICSNEVASVSWDEEDKSMINLKLHGNNNPYYELDVVLKLQTGDRNYEKKIKLYLAPKRRIWDVVLDFGSEASQMAVSKRSDTLSYGSIVNLFSDVKDLILPVKNEDDKNEDDNNNFCQYEEGNVKLFKSQFFIKKSIDEESFENAAKSPVEVSDEVRNNMLKVLTRNEDLQDKKFKEDYFVAPNVKLHGFGGIELPRVSVVKENGSCYQEHEKEKNSYLYYRLSLFLFIKLAIEKLQNQEDSRFISFHFLMPNVYEQVEIVKILRLLQKDISAFIAANKDLNIKGFEVTAVSESDASMIGVCEFMASEKQLPAGNYLLLDAGKGTLDFSLINREYKDGIGWTYKNIWRSGIIGAGNSLTYAYLVALVRQYLELRLEKNNIDDNDVKVFISKILNADIYYLSNIMKNVDKYKKKGLSECVKDDANKNKMDELKVEGFSTWLEECVSENRESFINKGKSFINMGYKGYVDNMIEKLVKQTKNAVNVIKNENMKVDKVVFTGRAFCLGDFKTRMLEMLKNKLNPKIEEIDFLQSNQNISIKNVCLFCVEPIIRGEYNRKIFSDLIFGENKKQVTEQTEGSWFDNKINILKNIAIKIIHKQTNLDDAMTGECERQMRRVTFNNYEFDINNPQDAYVKTGGMKYPLRGVREGNISVFFDGEKYVWRQERIHGNFGRIMNFAVSDFFFSSFFPNITVQGAENVKLDCQNNIAVNGAANVNNPEPGGQEKQSEEKTKSLGSESNPGNDWDKLLRGDK